MSARTLDSRLLARFGTESGPTDGDAFARSVRVRAGRLERGARRRRWGAAVLVALVLFGLDGAFLPLSGLLLRTVVALDGGVVAELLAPVNTLGTLFSAVLLGVRALLRRILRPARW